MRGRARAQTLERDSKLETRVARGTPPARFRESEGVRATGGRERGEQRAAPRERFRKGGGETAPGRR